MKKDINSNKINNKSKNLLSSAIAASLLLFGAAACSPDANVVDNGVYNEDYDTELVANRDMNAFTAWDYNSDDNWDESEFTSASTEMGVFDDWDTNNDDLFSENEFNEGLYNTFDEDMDGYVNKEEFGNAYASWDSRETASFDDWDMNNDQVLDDNELFNGIGQAGIYDNWDMDYDGMLTDDEFNTGVFNTWDYNNDNYIGFNEFNEFGFDDWGL